MVASHNMRGASEAGRFAQRGVLTFLDVAPRRLAFGTMLFFFFDIHSSAPWGTSPCSTCLYRYPPPLFFPSGSRYYATNMGVPFERL
jgi:hypothetical protein